MCQNVFMEEWKGGGIWGNRALPLLLDEGVIPLCFQHLHPIQHQLEVLLLLHLYHP